MTEREKVMVVTDKLWLVVLDEDGEPLLAVKSNGTVEHGKRFTPDKAQAVFDKLYTSKECPHTNAVGSQWDDQVHCVCGKVWKSWEEYHRWR